MMFYQSRDRFDMPVIMHLETSRTRLVRVDASGISLLGCWDASIEEDAKASVIGELLDHFAEHSESRVSELTVVVDFNGDAVHLPISPVQLSTGRRRSPALGGVSRQWLNSNLQRHLGQRRYGAGLFGTGLFGAGKPYVGGTQSRLNVWRFLVMKTGLGASVERFYILSAAFESSPWLALLMTLDQISVRALYPSTLLIESAVESILDQHPSVLFFHVDAERVVRHTLYINGKIRFTRVLPIESPDNDLVLVQLQETLRYLNAREFDLSVPPVALVPADLPLAQRKALDREITTIELPLIGQHRSCTADLSESDRYWLSLLYKTERRQRRQLISTNLAGVLEKNIKEHKYRLSSLGLLWMSALVLVVFNSGNAYRYHTLDQRQMEDEKELAELTDDVQRAPLSAHQMRSMVLSHQLLARHRELPARMLVDLGRLNTAFASIRINRLEWCGRDSGARCHEDLEAELRIRSPLDGSDLNAPSPVYSPDIDLLQLRITGVLEGEFSNLREEYEYYHQWIDTVVADGSFDLVRHEHQPHQAISSSSGRSDLSGSNLSGRFGVVLAYVSANESPKALGNQRSAGPFLVSRR